MTPTGPRQERETIINFNEDDDLAEIWTASGVIHRRLLKRLGAAHLVEDGERHSLFRFPARFITLPRVKIPKAMDDATRAAKAANLQKNRGSTRHDA